ncbi:MAG: SufS family cysteine desulfurase [Sphingobacteriaceae bacterium]|nr:SufS family cysteine desulfurase [Sphingobacteriaceae bacterium]
MVDSKHIREQFPILNKRINNKSLVYFDNGATTQKPKVVIDSIVKYYSEQNANIHRGVHTLSREATELFESSRQTVSSFINSKTEEIIFTSGTTDSINIVANGLDIPKGSEIIVSQMEHHSNILPWQLWCERNNGKLKVIPINRDGTLQIEKLEGLITHNTAVVALTHVSNTLGVINPVNEIIQKVKAIDQRILVLIDGAQSVPHMSIDVKNMDCDFFVFSGHKMYAPTGCGVLYVKKGLMDQLKLSKTGGGTIKTVSFERTEYVNGPLRFEAGTPNIEAVIGLAKACEFMNSIGTNNISDHEHALLVYAQNELRAIEGVEIYADHSNKAAVISFNVKGQHPFDVGTLLDKYGVAVRTGHHCTQPLMNYYGIQGTIRASFAIYNVKEEIDIFIEALKKGIKLLS